MACDLNKTNVLHLRNMRQKCTNISFSFGGNFIETVDKYKYLGDNQDVSSSSEVLSDAVIAKTKLHLNKIDYKT